MNFELDEMQVMLKDSVARFIEKEYDFEQRRKLVHDGGGFSNDHWATFAELGWLGAFLAEEEGGYGGGAVEAAIIMEEFGRALVVEPFLSLAILVTQTLVGSGDPRSLDLVQALVAGESHIALAHSEPQARGRIEHVVTRAEAIGDGWRLSGRKSLVIGAPFADRLLVSARTSGNDSDREGISLFLMPADLPGVERIDVRLADGSRASEILFDKVNLTADAVLGVIGEGYAALDRGHAHAIIGLCAEAVGAMDGALWMTRDYLQTREQFGKPLGSFQSLQHRMAEMLIELELSRSILYRALAHIDASPEDRAHAMAVAKVQVSKSLKFVGGQAIQLHGGIGVTEEYKVGHYFKRLTFLDNLFGQSQLHLDRMAERYKAQA